MDTTFALCVDHCKLVKFTIMVSQLSFLMLFMSPLRQMHFQKDQNDITLVNMLLQKLNVNQSPCWNVHFLSVCHVIILFSVSLPCDNLTISQQMMLGLLLSPIQWVSTSKSKQ